MRFKGFVLLSAIVSSLVFAGCKEDPVPPNNRVPCNGTTPTWNSKVADIIANSCFGSSCHGSGAAAGDYTTYALIKPVLLNGKFEQQVITSRIMPRGGVLPDSSLATLECWLETGFPEN